MPINGPRGPRSRQTGPAHSTEACTRPARPVCHSAIDAESVLLPPLPLPLLLPLLLLPLPLLPLLLLPLLWPCEGGEECRAMAWSGLGRPVAWGWGLAGDEVT